jgi:hypothetical protein
MATRNENEEQQQERSERTSKDNAIFWLKELAGMVETDQITAAELRTMTFNEATTKAREIWEEAQTRADKLKSED